MQMEWYKFIDSDHKDRLMAPASKKKTCGILAYLSPFFGLLIAMLERKKKKFEGNHLVVFI